MKFKLELFGANQAQPDGTIDLYYDANDGNGYVRYIRKVNTSYNQFAKMHFKYKTGTTGQNYHIYIDNVLVQGPGDLPVITAHPQNQTVTEGATATFSVTASGSGLSYQWKKNSATEGF